MAANIIPRARFTMLLVSAYSRRKSYVGAHTVYSLSGFVSTSTLQQYFYAKLDV